MFQYAFGRALAKRRKAFLVLNRYSLLSQPLGVTPRSYALGSFALNDSIVISDEPYSVLLNRFAKRVPLLDRLLSVRFERNLSFDSDALNDSQSLIFEGYWQSYRYFEEINEILSKEFRFRGPYSASFLRYANEMKAKPSVMLHVRRGDYVSTAAAFSHHGVLNLSYYKSAVTKVLRQEPQARFFVFSDDIGWCRQALNFLPADTRYIEPDDGRCDVQELILMSLCRHHIIANSSFSWWAAWLAHSNQNKNTGMTFAPIAWFANQHVDKHSRFPAHWIVL